MIGFVSMAKEGEEQSNNRYKIGSFSCWFIRFD